MQSMTVIHHNIKIYHYYYSYCTAIFNIDIVYSNLHESMRTIFMNNSIPVYNIECEEGETSQHKQICKFCIRGISLKNYGMMIINQTYLFLMIMLYHIHYKIQIQIYIN